MKNLIDPNLLARFKDKPTPLEEIVNFLDGQEDITTAQLSKLIDVESSKIYNYRGHLKRKANRENSDNGNEVIPKNSSKKYNRYTAKEKFILVQEYLKSNDESKSELLRKYGLYLSDITRWMDQIEEASLDALGTRKKRSDKKSDEQIRIEELEQELREQEKTTAKLSALIVLQKKTSALLKRKD